MNIVRPSCCNASLTNSRLAGVSSIATSLIEGNIAGWIKTILADKRLRRNVSEIPQRVAPRDANRSKIRRFTFTLSGIVIAVSSSEDDNEMLSTESDQESLPVSSREKWLALIALVLVTIAAIALLHPR